MILPNDMRSNNQTPLLVFIEIFDKQIFIRGPTAACDKYLIFLFEGFDNGKRFLLVTNLEHAIKTGITSNGHIRDAKCSQQLPTHLILEDRKSTRLNSSH